MRYIFRVYILWIAVIKSLHATNTKWKKGENFSSCKKCCGGQVGKEKKIFEQVGEIVKNYYQPDK